LTEEDSIDTKPLWVGPARSIDRLANLVVMLEELTNGTVEIAEGYIP
jgi:hypothetical protein